ncbi:hypothetical protein DPEC_G00242480 [Dallia pectoralis]|uniref:Uncharacterized protein n=1 Tax=Dallia pectoralis TaxID=75939 RepID=A0ACC2FVH9_DALPE|nr:hypothetical protein DPEC_G00242480 [Dallia pectoralis]
MLPKTGFLQETRQPHRGAGFDATKEDALWQCSFHRRSVMEWDTPAGASAVLTNGPTIWSCSPEPGKENRATRSRHGSHRAVLRAWQEEIESGAPEIAKGNFSYMSIRQDHNAPVRSVESRGCAAFLGPSSLIKE